MSRHAGVSRSAAGLTALLEVLAAAAPAGLLTAAPPAGAAPLDLATVEATNLHTVSVLVAAAALARAESRGCHRRSDAAAAADQAQHSVLRWADGRLVYPVTPVAGPATPVIPGVPVPAP